MPSAAAFCLVGKTGKRVRNLPCKVSIIGGGGGMESGSSSEMFAPIFLYYTTNKLFPLEAVHFGIGFSLKATEPGMSSFF